MTNYVLLLLTLSKATCRSSSQTLFLLLSSHFSLPTNTTLFNCKIGAGIGLEHSAAIANLAFYLTCEKNLVSQLQQCGIIRYARYHDESREALLAFCAKLKANSGFFIFEARQFGSNNIDFLDLTITQAAGRLIVEPTLTKLLLPLCPTSAHSRATLTAWPLAVSRRAQSLASSPTNAIARLTDIYRKVPCHPAILAALQDDSAPRTSPLPHEANLDRLVSILHFHPVLQRSWNLAIKRSPIPVSLGFKISSTWANGLPSVAGTIAKHNLNFCKGNAALSIVD